MEKSVKRRLLLAGLLLAGGEAAAQATIGGSRVVGLSSCATTFKQMTTTWRIGGGQWGEAAKIYTANKINFHNHATKQVVSTDWRYHNVGHELSGTEYFKPPGPVATAPVQGVPTSTGYWAAVLEVWAWNATARRYDYAGSATIPHSNGSPWCQL